MGAAECSYLESFTLVIVENEEIKYSGTTSSGEEISTHCY